MKTLIFILMLVTSSAFASNLICSTPSEVSGWTGSSTFEKMTLTATFEHSSRLVDATLNGAYETDTRTLDKSTKYKNVNPRYNNYSQFALLEDAWNWFTILLPKDFSSSKRRFVAYVQILHEGGGYTTERMNCSIK